MKLRLVILFSVISVPCFAGVMSGPYVGASIGVDNQIVTFNPGVANISTNGSQLYNSSAGFMGRLNVGYNFNKYSGIELAPSYYFPQNYNYPAGGSVDIGATSLDLSYLFSLPISQSKFSVFGRVGLAYDWVNSGSENNTNCGCGNQSLSNLAISGSNFADLIGSGLNYNLSNNTSVRVEWIANGLLFPIGLSSNSQNVANWTTQQFLAGVNYHF